MLAVTGFVADSAVRCGVKFVLEFIDSATATVVLTAVLVNEHVQLAALLNRQVLALRLAEIQVRNLGWLSLR